MRIGHGYDVHRFTDGEFVVIGGTKIPYEKKLEAHSDGDVLAHAIADALLGACGVRDIGYFFPDTDIKYKNANSMELLSKVKEIITEITLKMTHITQVPDEQVEEVIAQDKCPEIQRTYAELMKLRYGMDDVVVSDVKKFVRDVKS